MLRQALRSGEVNIDFSISMWNKIVSTLANLFSEVFRLKIFFEQLINQISPVFPILTVGIGGAVATYIWWWYRRPHFSLAEPSVVRGYDLNEKKYQIMRICVKNEGITAANNCKAKIKLQGSLNSEEYRIDSILEWSQGGNTIVLNSGEEAFLDVIRINGYGTQIKTNDQEKKMVEVVSGSPSENSTTIESYRKTECGKSFDELWDNIGVNELLDSQLEENKLILTSKNAKRHEFHIEFSSGDPVDIELHPT